MVGAGAGRWPAFAGPRRTAAAIPIQMYDSWNSMADIEVSRDGTGEGAMHARQAEFMRDVASLIIRSAQRRRESRVYHISRGWRMADRPRWIRRPTR